MTYFFSGCVVDLSELLVVVFRCMCDEDEADCSISCTSVEVGGGVGGVRGNPKNF